MRSRASSRPLGRPDLVLTYFRMEWGTLLVVTVSGILYNVGLLAGPWFEGKLVQCLLDIFHGKKTFSDMLRLASAYVLAIAAVQLARYVKRLYVRRFANNVNRSMKHVLYGNLVHMGKRRLEQEDVGSVMTKALSDVDACAEGMRKFTTEIFDTGVALLGYAVLLLWYDWRLALLCLCFTPFAYLAAEKMKTVVQRTGAALKESTGRLNAASLDRASGALTYRVFGCEGQRDQAYEERLADYEKSAVQANLWVSAMPPLYQAISMLGVLPLLYFGAKNVNGTGWAAWDIAAFTTFLSCFGKLSVKSSKAAKLFNSVHKAQVSWKRIKPLMKPVPEEQEAEILPGAELKVRDLAFAYPDAPPVFSGLSFSAKPGQIIGVTGPVACGKSTFGKAFLCEEPYAGSIRFGGRELSGLEEGTRKGIVGYLGHDPELLSASVRDNVLLGKEGDAEVFLRAVCLNQEVAEMPEGADTRVGSGGVRLSGGQRSRLALARTLAHRRPLLILDDPFAALDRETEREVFQNLRAMAGDSTVILISHRLYLFPQMDQVIWMEGGQAQVSTHRELMDANLHYANLYWTQCEAGDSGPREKCCHGPGESGVRRGGRQIMRREKRRGRKENLALRAIFEILGRQKLLLAGVLLTALLAVLVALLPPLVLEEVIDRLAGGSSVPFSLAAAYFGLTVLGSLLEAVRECLLTLLGQKITHGLRSRLCGKLSQLPADGLSSQEPGAVASRFVGDVDTVEALFTSGIISMFADACKVISIFAIIFVKNRGLALLLLVILPLLFAFTRHVQRRMLAAQIENRAATARASGHVPESIRCIRTVHTLGKERYMREKYDSYIQESYAAVEKTNFYDAVYSPVILILSAAVTAAVMLLSATGNSSLNAFFGMSVGTAAAVVSYISQIFTPLESIGMEIQTIQSAVAGITRIDEFLRQEERQGADPVEDWERAVRGGETVPGAAPCIELRDVDFCYVPEVPVLEGVSFAVERGGQATLTGRTGAGKSTVFKLLLGLYRPDSGSVRILGRDAAGLPDQVRRKLFGYVEQSFYLVPGTVLEEITLFDARISPADARATAKTVGLHETILRLPEGYDTPCTPALFSQGQWQLLSIARAVAADPVILLLDEITANLDSDTEQMVLAALQRASEGRTVLSISHRLYRETGGRQISI